MKRKKIFIVLAVVAIIAGCGKGVPFDGAKIATVTNVKANYTTTYTYNADGAIASMKQNTGSKVTFQYNDSNVLQNNYTLGQNVSSAISYTKNAAGLVDTAQGEYLYGNYSYAFIFDGNSQITQQKNYVLGALQSTVTYTNVNKNVYKIDSNLVGSNTHFYDYYTYIPSNSNSIGVQNQGRFFLGASSANLVLSDVKIDNNLDTVDVISYRYRYDVNGFVDTLSSYHRTGQLIDSLIFTYY